MNIYPSDCQLINSARARVAVNPAPTEPVTKEQAKEWLKMEEIDTDDEIITDLITEARQWLEKYCGICLVESQVDALVSVKNRQELPYGPVRDLSAITITDLNDNAISTGCIQIQGFDNNFPVLMGYGQFKVSYVSGYDPIPQPLLGAMKSYIAFAYEHRGEDLDENSSSFAPKARQKAFPYRRNIGF